MIGYGNSYFISTILDAGVGNPPVNTVAPVISGGTSLGSVLSSTTGTWTGDAPITYTYQWYRGINAIGGATNSTYTLVVADSSQSITCQVTATNIKGSSSAASNVITAQTFTAPVNTVAPAITGTAQEGQTLTCSTGTWTGTPTITYAYQWKRNNVNIGSATNSTYLLVSADVGQSIKCTVTATNAIGSVNADSNSVTPIAAVDPDAQAFITAASITDPTQQSAINQLVVDLKGYNIWTKMKALYPFVGGTAAQHKWNLKDPRDLDVAFRLVFTGGWTHSATGATPNGVNANAQTKLIPSSVLSINSKHVSIYSRTNSSVGFDIMAHTISAITPYDLLSIRSTIFFSNEIAYSFNEAYPDSRGNNLDSTGFYISTRTQSNAKKLYKNNSILSTASSVSSTQPTTQYIIASDSRNVNFSNRQYAFASIGDGLTDTEAANFYTAVQAFQVALSRNI